MMAEPLFEGEDGDDALRCPMVHDCDQDTLLRREGPESDRMEGFSLKQSVHRDRSELLLLLLFASLEPEHGPWDGALDPVIPREMSSSSVAGVPPGLILDCEDEFTIGTQGELFQIRETDRSVSGVEDPPTLLPCVQVQ